MPNFNAKPIKCPACKHGYLEPMNKAEKKKLAAKEKINIGDKILGCDECQYWREAE